MGHELSGLVKEVGKNVTNVKVGDRVVLDPVFACNTCDICKSGHLNVCSDVKCYGVQMDGDIATISWLKTIICIRLIRHYI